ncbi:uncharacterized protein SOCE26_073990 [Sorangium cellulosum]|uniref:Uncharacterized protein n=1 Tax=Sorangium cellulosum TaxID=56 RepID=A0A2L0F368_SORCE|nr:hypothetical protein [Sorangium cellulosum]AUX45899.1 uncharacterized protein SOCE26_073990 [Sorangium cellulosum]
MSPSERANLSRLGQYIVVRLLCKHDGYSARDIAKTLKAVLKDRGSDAEQQRLVEAELTTLTRAGLIKGVRKSSFMNTPSGWRAALGAIARKDLPPKPVWKDLKEQLDNCVNARIVKTLTGAFRLAVAPEPTLQQVIDALLWHVIKVETSEPFTAEAVTRVLLNRLAGTPTLLPVDQALDELVAKASAPPLNAPSVPSGAPVPAGAALPADDTAFAARVLAAARSSKTGRFGDDKVFISHVFQRLADQGDAVGDPDAFKARLVSAHRRGLLSLNRADLVEAMDPADVDASETRYLSATFHFVRI